MLNYPEHLVSFMVLYTTGHEERDGAVPRLTRGAARPGCTGDYGVSTLWSGDWPAWAPGERRTAVIALVPRLPQDITLHLSVVLDEVPLSVNGVTALEFCRAHSVSRRSAGRSARWYTILLPAGDRGRQQTQGRMVTANGMPRVPGSQPGSAR